MIRQVIGFVSAMTVTAAVAAESKRLTGEMLTETVPGSTISLDTPIGTKIPMRFGADGIVTGEAGILASYLGSAKDRGRWSVENHKLCIKWFRWFESQPRCMEITIDGERVTWRRDDGDTGTGTLVEVGQGRVAEKKVVAAKQAVAVKQAVATAAASTGAPVPPAAPPPPAAMAEEAPVAPPQAEVAAAAVPPISTETKMNVGAALPVDANGPAIAVLNPGVAVSPAELSAAEPPTQVAARTTEPPAQSAEAASQPTEPAVTAGASAPAAVVAPANPQFSPVRATTTVQKPVTARKPAVAALDGRVPAKPAKSKVAAAKPTGPLFRVARVEPDDMLNIRQGPSETHPAIGVISSSGRGVQIVGACAGEWCPVKHGGVSGWVNRYYLTAE